MRVHKRVYVAAAIVALGTFGLSSSAGAAPAPEPRTAAVAAVAPANSVNSAALIDGQVKHADIGAGQVSQSNMYGPFVKALYGVYNGTVHYVSLDSALKAKVDSTTGKVSGVESDSPYPGATQLGDNPGNGTNSTVKFIGDNGATLQRAWVQCADGKTAIGGGFQRADESVAAIKNLQIVTSAATQVKDGKEVYVPIAGDKAGSLVPNAWLVEGFNNGTEALIVRPSVVCATIGK